MHAISYRSAPPPSSFSSQNVAGRPACNERAWTRNRREKSPTTHPRPTNPRPTHLSNPYRNCNWRECGTTCTIPRTRWRTPIYVWCLISARASHTPGQLQEAGVAEVFGGYSVLEQHRRHLLRRVLHAEHVGHLLPRRCVRAAESKECGGVKRCARQGTAVEREDFQACAVVVGVDALSFVGERGNSPADI